MSIRCEACGVHCVSLGQHRRQWPQCRPACEPCEPASDPPPSAEVKPSIKAEDLRFGEIANHLGRRIAAMHLESLVEIAHCKAAVALAKHAVELTIQAMLSSKVHIDTALEAELKAVGARCVQTVGKLNNIDAVVARQAPGALKPVQRPLLAAPAESKKHFAFFSLTEQIADMLQNDTETRQHCRASSREYCTGRYRRPPDTITDVIHAERFRQSPASRVRFSNNRLVLVGNPWNDDATVSEKGGEKAHLPA